MTAPTNIAGHQCSDCGKPAEGGIIDLWTGEMGYLCRAHLQAEFDSVRPPPLDALERAVVEVTLDIARLDNCLAAMTHMEDSPQWFIDHKALRLERNRAVDTWKKAGLDILAARAAYLPDDAALLKEAMDCGHQHGDR